MSPENFIPLDQLCLHYEVEMSFFNNLSELGMIEISSFGQSPFIDFEKMNDIEKMIRIHQDLQVNLEGIDVVFNLLQKIEDLQQELLSVKNRLRIYENEA